MIDVGRGNVFMVLQIHNIVKVYIYATRTVQKSRRHNIYVIKYLK